MLRTQHPACGCFFLRATTNVGLWTKTLASGWQARWGARPASVCPSVLSPAPGQEPPSAKGVETHFQARHRSELTSSKDFFYINIKVLMYLEEFQLKLVGIKMI